MATSMAIATTEKHVDSQSRAAVDRVELYWKANEAWTEFEVPFDYFRDALARAEIDGGSAFFFEDLYLAVACELRLPKALRIFETSVLTTAAVLALHELKWSAQHAEDLANQMRIRIVEGEAGKRPLISEYDGRSPLEVWTMNVCRTAIEERKKP